MTLAPAHPIPAVGLVCWNASGQVLLIQRGKPPNAGAWSLPGGRVHWAEGVEAAARRELLEETGIEAGPLTLIAVVDGMFAGAGDKASNVVLSHHYVLIDYSCEALDDRPARAGDDARAARWVDVDELPQLGLWKMTLDLILADHHRRQAQR